MRQFYYNQFRNNGIKGIVIGLITVSVNVIIIYLFFFVLNTDGINLSTIVIVFIIEMILLWGLQLITFGQVIEKTSDGRIAIFYKLGSQKFKHKTFGLLTSTSLTQDPERYYCLTVKTSDGGDLLLERHPTLRQANERLEDLQRAIG